MIYGTYKLDADGKIIVETLRYFDLIQSIAIHLAKLKNKKHRNANTRKIVLGLLTLDFKTKESRKTGTKEGFKLEEIYTFR